MAFTRRGKTIYAIYLAVEGQDAPPATITLSALCPAPGSRPKVAPPPLAGSATSATIEMLGVKKPLLWRADTAGITIEIPAAVLASPPCRHACVLKLKAESGGADGANIGGLCS